MPLGLGHSLVRSGAPVLDPDAKSYIDAVKTAGATVTSTQSKAISNFFKTGKSQGWYSSLKRIYFPIWGVAAANARCLVSGISGTFNGTVNHESGYVSSDGSTGYFIADSSPSSLGLTTSSGSMFFLITGASAVGGGINLGRTQDLSNSTRFGFFGGGTNVRSINLFSAFFFTYSETDARSVLLATRDDASTVSAYKRTASGFSTTVNALANTVGEVGTSQAPTFFCQNANGVFSIFSPSTIKFGSYGVGMGFLSAEAESYTLALKTMWETCTGLTLP